jgi:hypothetical protein
MCEPMDCREDEYSKQKIPVELKTDLWFYYAGQQVNTQCFTCSRLISMPEEVKKYCQFNIDNTQYCNAQYGHIISEYNGGEISFDNLVLQCQKCNVELKNKNIFDLFKKIDNINLNFIQYKTEQQKYIVKELRKQLDENKCIYLLKPQLYSNKYKFRFCKNKSIENCNLCSSHKGKQNIYLDDFNSLPYFYDLLNFN